MTVDADFIILVFLSSGLPGHPFLPEISPASQPNCDKAHVVEFDVITPLRPLEGNGDDEFAIRAVAGR